MRGRLLPLFGKRLVAYLGESWKWIVSAILGDVLYLALTNNPISNALGDWWYIWTAVALVSSWMMVFWLRKLWAMGNRDFTRIWHELAVYFSFFAILFPISIGGIYVAHEWLNCPRFLAQAFFMLVPPLIFKEFAKRFVFVSS